MSETQAGTETPSSQASGGSGKHRGPAAGSEDPGQHARGRHRRPPEQGDAE